MFQSPRAPVWVRKIGCSADLDRVEGGLVAGVRAVDGEAHLVHAADGLSPEGRQSPVAGLLEAGAERVGLAIGDAQDPQADPVEDLDPVEFVLDHGRALLGRHKRDAFLAVRLVDVVHALALDDEVLVREVAEAHPHVVDDVVPLPPVLRRDARRAVEEVVEDAVPPGVGQRLVGCVHAAFRVVGADLVGLRGEKVRVLVQRDHERALDEVKDAGLLGGRERHEVRLEERLALDQVVFGEVAVGPDVLVGPVARVVVGERQGGAPAGVGPGVGCWANRPAQ